MTDADEHSVVLALGIDPGVDYTVPDHVWDSLIRTAFDPDTPAADASVVPIMDDHGTVPDAGATDDSGIAHPDDLHGGHHPPDHAVGDGSHHGDVADHGDVGDHGLHDAGVDHEPDLGTHPTEHDHHGHGDDHPDAGGHGSDWHV